MADQLNKKPWHKTIGGVVVLILSFLILAVVLIFIGFFVYYSIQLKFGNASELNKQFVNENIKKTGITKLDLGEPISDWKKLIKESNPKIGQENAPITIIEFIDFECPQCIEAYPVFKQVMTKYEPVVRVVFKNLPFDKTHPRAVVSANAAACAKEQGKFWPYYEQLFERQDLTDEGLLLHAKDVGLDLEKFSLCLENKTYQKDINLDLMDAVSLKLLGTPSYVVNGYKIEGGVNEKTWDLIITQFLQK